MFYETGSKELEERQLAYRTPATMHGYPNYVFFSKKDLVMFIVRDYYKAVGKNPLMRLNPRAVLRLINHLNKKYLRLLETYYPHWNDDHGRELFHNTINFYTGVFKKQRKEADKQSRIDALLQQAEAKRLLVEKIRFQNMGM